MKKRILFVDDERLVFSGLQRMLRALSEERDMTFVESGHHALELMLVQAFDVVVSDSHLRRQPDSKPGAKKPLLTSPVLAA